MSKLEWIASGVIVLIVIALFVGMFFTYKEQNAYDKLNLECARAGGIGERIDTWGFTPKIECRRDISPIYVK